MDQPAMYHHAASEQSQSFEILVPGTSHRYHRFDAPHRHNDTSDRKRSSDSKNHKDIHREGKARRETHVRDTAAAEPRITPMHDVEEPAVTDPFRVNNDVKEARDVADDDQQQQQQQQYVEKLVDVPSPQRDAPFRNAPQEQFFNAKRDSPILPLNERVSDEIFRQKEAETIIRQNEAERWKTRLRDEQLHEQFAREEARLQNALGQERSSDNDLRRAHRAEHQQRQEREREQQREKEEREEEERQQSDARERRVAFSDVNDTIENDGRGDEGAEENGARAAEDEKKQTEKEQQNKKKTPMSAAKKRLIYGIVTFVVTTALVFIILALFNPPFVQKSLDTKNFPENVTESNGAIYGASAPTDLAKTLVYSVIAGGVAVALPYAWKLVSSATHLPPNKILDEPDYSALNADVPTKDTDQRRRHRRRNR